MKKLDATITVSAFELRNKINELIDKVNELEERKVNKPYPKPHSAYDLNNAGFNSDF